jgi:hypothetical protein
MPSAQCASRRSAGSGRCYASVSNSCPSTARALGDKGTTRRCGHNRPFPASRRNGPKHSSGSCDPGASVGQTLGRHISEEKLSDKLKNFLRTWPPRPSYAAPIVNLRQPARRVPTMPRQAKPTNPRRPTAAEPVEATPPAAPLSPQWAFVVQLREGTPLAPAQLSGRVEHLVSGQATPFASLAELLAFMVQILTPRRRPRLAPPPPIRTRTTIAQSGQTTSCPAGGRLPDGVVAVAYREGPLCR